MPSNKRSYNNSIDEGNDTEEEISQNSGKHKKVRYSDEADTDLATFVNKEAEVGIVEKIILTNFMCHKKLEINFGANVNFVIGRNGSGKSAILSGLIVGLGGKANVTKRGNTLKTFIKEGCHSATICISLRNQGKEAYKHDEYGDSIIVERRLTSDGSNTYKLKSKEGKLISQKKDDLVQILDQFNIQIDNPVSILTQDTSRSFLNTSNEKDKYSFFLKATQLEKITDDYQKIIEEKECTKEMLEQKKKVLPELRNEVKIHEEKYNDMQQLKKMKQTVKELKNELVWAMVNEAKQKMKLAEKTLTKLDSKVPNYERKFTEASGKVEESEITFNQKLEQIKTFKEDITILLNEKEQLSTNNRKKKDNLKRAQTNCRNLEREIKNAEKDKKALIEAINDAKNTVMKDFEGERLAREANLNEKLNEKKQYESQLNVSSQYFKQIEANIREKTNRKDDIQKNLTDVHQNTEKLKKRIQDLEANKKNKLAVFGINTMEILKHIENLNKQKAFHRKPIGPLGSLIELKDKRWGKAVEKCIGKNMYAYACHDSHDMRVMKDVFRKVAKGRRFPEPPIILSEFSDERYNVSKYAPGPRFLTVLDNLDIENHTVANSLIDQANIETILLIGNAKEAQRVMWNESSRPKFSLKALSREGHEVIGGRISKYYPNKKKHQTFFQHDISDSIRSTEVDLQRLQQDKERLRSNLLQLDAEIQIDKREHNKTRKKCMSEQDVINNLQMEIQELQTNEDDKTPDISVFETDLKETESKLELLNEKHNEAQVLVDEKKEDLDVHTLEDCINRCQQASVELETMQEELLNLEQQLKTDKGHKKHYEDLLKNLRGDIAEKTKSVEKERANYKKTERQAKEYCSEEISTERERKTIENEIDSAERRISAEESRRGNSDEITNNYYTARKKYQDASAQVKNCRNNLKKIDNAMITRVRRYTKFRSNVSSRAKHFFDMFLSQRGYTGKITFAHKEEKLRIEVNVENHKGANLNDSKALSGGERSFSTISFIMALWDAMECPFRCLDEFDVFMDMLNRRISMDMLLKIARQQANRQFILLTPQDMSSVSGSSRVRIFKLHDPERGQQTLGFETDG